MTAAVFVDSTVFAERLERLREHWKSPKAEEPLRSANALMISLGAPSDTTVYQKSTALFTWLLGYEFPETVLVITKTAVAFLASHKKAAILEPLRRPDVRILRREKEPGKSDLHFKELWGLLAGGQSRTKVGLFERDRIDGPMHGEWMAYLRGHDREIEWVDVSSGVGSVLAVKDGRELEMVGAASRMSLAVMERFVLQRVLRVVDEGRQVSHARLAEEIESHISSQLGRYQDRDASLSLDHLDICYPPIVQSGGTYSLKPSAVSNDDALHAGTVVCSLGVRYRSYCSNIARTFLVSPSARQETNLQFLLDLHAFCLGQLRPGVAISHVHQQVVERVRALRPDLEKHLTPNLGFGMGLEFREPDLLINGKNPRLLASGMVFNLAIGLQDISDTPLAADPRARVYALFVADTVKIEPDTEAVRLTSGLGTVKEVVCSIEPSEAKPPVAGGAVLRSRLRHQQQADASTERQRREHQKELSTLRNKEALQRYGSDGTDGAQEKKPQVLRFESYRKETSLPRESLKDLQIFVDKRGETLILPLNGLAVPFHIATVKNVTKNDEGDYTFLRINFNTPGRTFGKKEAAGPPLDSDPSAEYVRGITFRTADSYHGQQVFRDIQDLRKQVTDREAARKEMSDLVEQAELVELTGRRPPRLADVYVRPPLETKRLPGDVEIHSNGFRYKTQLRSDQRIDILFSNVKHFVFQPCDNETIVVIHLHLHHPIMVGKKKTRDIQFFREALESLVDETSGRRSRMRFGDEDELAQEQEERRRRAEANAEFKAFAEKAVELSKVHPLDVEIPYRDLGFTGVVAKQNVLLQPTTECLVQLVEPPFLVVPLVDVEIAYLERVLFGLKNFDLVLIFKDHTQPPVAINSIPMSSLEPVKEWLDSVDVLYAESKVNFNWTNILKMIAKDPVDFYETGGWANLQPDEEGSSAAGSEAEEESSEYEPESDEEDVYSDVSDSEEAYSDASEDEESEPEEEDDDDDDAPDWDELEAEAAREDARREPAVQPKRKAPPPARTSRRKK